MLIEKYNINISHKAASHIFTVKGYVGYNILVIFVIIYYFINGFLKRKTKTAFTRVPVLSLKTHIL